MAPAQGSAPPGGAHAAPHHPVTVWLHALMAPLVLGQLALGWWMLGVPKAPPGPRAAWFNLHKSVGLTLGLLWLVRVAWLAWRPAKTAAALPAWQRRAALFNHALLYVGMGLLPLSGLLGSGFSPYPVQWFGWTLPRWAAPWPQAKAACSFAHEGAAWLMTACIAAHLAAVAWHAASGERSVLRAMLPRLTRTGRGSRRKMPRPFGE